MNNNWSDGSGSIETSVCSSISLGSVIKGIVSFRGNTKLNCKLEGDLTCDANLVVGRDSKIRANIRSLNVEVYGQVVGDINAENLIELHPGARVTGDIKAKRVAMHDGVNFDGKCHMLSDAMQDNAVQDDTVLSNNSAKVVHLNEQLLNAKVGESK